MSINVVSDGFVAITSIAWSRRVAGSMSPMDGGAEVILNCSLVATKHKSLSKEGFEGVNPIVLS